MTPRAQRFPLVDSMRALACLWVLLFHAAFVTAFLQVDSVIQPFLAVAGIAPTLFFIISGFLLYRPFARAHIAAEDTPDTSRYAWGRFLRVTPAYWVALTVVALVLGLDEVLSLSGAATYYGFAQIYDTDHAFSGIQQAWTLCVEVTFYAVLPIWALLIRSLRVSDERRRLLLEFSALALLFLASVAYKVWLLHRTDPSSLEGGPRFVPLPNYLDAFAVGMAAAVVSVWHERHGAFERPIAFVREHAGAIWIAAAVLTGLTGLWLGFTEPGQTLSRLEFLLRWEIQVLIALLLLIPAAFAATDSGRLTRVLGSGPFLFVGLVSYGLYLYHYAVIDLVDEHVVGPMSGGATVSFLVTLAIALPVGMLAAAASYYAIERPALGLKRLVGKPPPSPAEATAEPAPASPAPDARAAR